MNERLKRIYYLIEKELNNAPGEELLSKEQNEMYAEMQNLKESLEELEKATVNDGELKIINEDNIDEFRDKIDINYSDSIKSSSLNLLETSYSYILESNRFNEDMLNDIAYNVCGNEDFNNHMDSLIMREIEECARENDIQDYEEEEKEDDEEL